MSEEAREKVREDIEFLKMKEDLTKLKQKMEDERILLEEKRKHDKEINQLQLEHQRDSYKERLLWYTIIIALSATIITILGILFLS